MCLEYSKNVDSDAVAGVYYAVLTNYDPKINVSMIWGYHRFYGYILSGDSF